MWPLVAALLLGSACCGSAQLIFNKTKSVEFTFCNETVVIPCFVKNVEAVGTMEMYVKWRFKGKYIFIYDGGQNKSTAENDFSSAKIAVSELLKGDASLKMDKRDAVLGNYTCEVTELSREGETTVELKYRVALKYKSNRTNKKIILLLIAGLLLTVIVIVGAILFVPGEYSIKNASGLGFIVISTGILISLQYNVFMTAFGMTSFTVAILITQVLGYVLAVVGLCLCIMACVPVHGPLLISGLGIIALAELLGLVYMKFVASNQKTIQPPRNN
uniref:Leukocyte surface antigen CD47 n=1 Tax=Oryctolagus cuniculus TaxID=9986 RepID=A0A5F9CZS8_RABIT